MAAGIAGLLAVFVDVFVAEAMEPPIFTLVNCGAGIDAAFEGAPAGDFAVVAEAVVVPFVAVVVTTVAGVAVFVVEVVVFGVVVVADVATDFTDFVAADVTAPVEA
jgi:hypothetical protein